MKGVVPDLLKCVFLCAGLVFCAGCRDDGPVLYQGYVEGEFVYVASPIGGRLDKLGVKRGDTVSADDVLFSLESTKEKAAVEQAKADVAQLQATIADMEKGARPAEIEAIQAQLSEARAEMSLAEAEYKRRKALLAQNDLAEEEYEAAKSEYDVKSAAVTKLEADLKTAKLGQRVDAIDAVKAQQRAAEAELEQAKWSLEQKTQNATLSGVVIDTICRKGDWVGAGVPVIQMLPPENRKVRFFVPEPVVGTLKTGQTVYVSYDGSNGAIPVKINYISAQAEYTPPVIYSSSSRAKLVFMIEAEPAADDAGKFHPGQPVDVSITEG